MGASEQCHADACARVNVPGSGRHRQGDQPTSLSSARCPCEKNLWPDLQLWLSPHHPTLDDVRARRNISGAQRRCQLQPKTVKWKIKENKASTQYKIFIQDEIKWDWQPSKHHPFSRRLERGSNPYIRSPYIIWRGWGGMPKPNKCVLQTNVVFTQWGTMEDSRNACWSIPP